MHSLKLHSNRPLDSNTVIGTLAVDGWAVTFGPARRGLGNLRILSYSQVMTYLNVVLTVKHILVECVNLKDARNKHSVASSIKDLFDNIEAHKIIDFIKKKLVL